MEKTKGSQTERATLFPFDPLVVLRDVCRRWLLVLVLSVAVGAGTYILTDMCDTPRYQTSATLAVTTGGGANTVYSDLSANVNLAAVFTDILNSDLFRSRILEEAGISDFSGTISASAAADTNILTVTVTDTDPHTALVILQTVLNGYEAITGPLIGDIVVEVLRAPAETTGPSDPADAMGRMWQVMLLTAAGTCLILAWHSFHRDAVRSGSEARQKLNCPYLGQIPHGHKRKPAADSRFVEAICTLGRRVRQRMKGGKVLMVTSLLEKEGKSTVAVNLAMALAKKYGKVLLIDCDLRKPACNILLDQHGTGPGLREVLNGGAQVSEALTRDSRTGLYLLPERKGGRDAGDLVASQAMGRVLAWAREEFDYVVLDLPSMSVATDAEALMDLVDGSLLVVRQNSAEAPALNKAIAALDRGRAKLLGCVLNDVYSTRLFSGQGGNVCGYEGYGGHLPQE